MSIITYFKDISGNDLGSIFMAGFGLNYDTNYKDSSGIDFRYLFMPLGSYSSITYNTYYKDISGNDLKNVFASIIQPLPFIISSTSYSYIYDYSNSMYYVTSNVSGTIEFITDISNDIHFILVGGGGAGGGSASQNYSGNGGGGGGAMDVYSSMESGISKNTIYSFYVGSGGIGIPGGSAVIGNSGTNTYVNSPSIMYILQSTGGGGGYSYNIYNPTQNLGLGGNSSITTDWNFSFTNITNNGGNGGITTPIVNYTGGFGNSSNLSSNYYNNSSSSSLNTIKYNQINNTFLIYNLMLFSGGGGGATEGTSSNGYSAWGGYGLPDFGGNIYGYTTNTIYPISSTTVGYGQNNDPSENIGFPNTSQSLYGIAPGGGGAGVGTGIELYKGGNGANGIIKFYFNYHQPILNNYFTLSGNAKYFLMNNGISNFFIINCWNGSSNINFTSYVSNCYAIVVGGGGGGGSGAYLSSILPNYFSGAGGGGAGSGVYTNITLNGIYDVFVGSGGNGGSISGSNGNSGGNTTVIKNSITYAIATGGGGGLFSTSQNATGGIQGNCSGNWTLSTINFGVGGNGGQGSEYGQDPSQLTSENQAMYGLSSSLINYTLPDGTICYFSGGGGGGSCKYSSDIIVAANYNGGGAGHGYGGFVGSSWNSEISSINGQNAKIFGAGGGGGSSNTSINTYTTGGNGADGLVLFIIPIS